MTQTPGPTAPAGTLEGLVIDWGGVLTPPLDTAMAAWAARDGVDLAHFRDVMRAWIEPRRPATEVHDSPLHRLERGELPVADFDAALAARLAEQGSTVDATGLTGRMLGDLARLDDSMLGLVRRARAAGIRTALLSNSWGNEYPAELMDGLFDAVVISGRVGMRKPELRIYQHTVDLLGLEPGACVMVDDLPHNVSAAAAAGLVGVLHRSYDETLGELEILFDRPLG